MDNSERDEIIERGLQSERQARCREIGFSIFFFKQVVDCLDKELDKANSDSRNQRFLTGRAISEFQKQPSRSKLRFEFTYSQTSACFVALLANFSYIEVVMTDEPGHPGSPKEQLLAFLLESGDSGAKAYKVNLDSAPNVEKEFSAQEIAEAIVAGMIRGRFD